MQGSAAVSNRALREVIPQAIGAVEAQRQVLLQFHDFNIKTNRRLNELEDRLAWLEQPMWTRVRGAIWRYWRITLRSRWASV